MNFFQITHCDQVNWNGNRVVLWVAGCSHHCKGCQNAYSQDPSLGLKFLAEWSSVNADESQNGNLF